MNQCGLTVHTHPCYTENNEGRESGEVDLHGLRAEEAIEYTEQAMLDAKHRGISNLRLIVGMFTTTFEE